VNFQVPQFIEEKPKIVGPFTIAQFGYLAAGGIVAFVLFQFLTPLIAGTMSAVVVGIALALALGKVDGVSVAMIMGGALRYVWQPRIYTWQRTFATQTLDTSGIEKIEAMRRRMGIEEKLKSAALAITTGRLFVPKPPTDRHERSESGAKLQVVSYLTGEKRVAKRIDYR
jgi:hypothetical protein